MREMLLSQGFSIGADGELLLPEDGSPRMEIDSGLIPHCPDDGLEMAPNLRSDDTFVEDDGWHEAAGRYADFLAVHGMFQFTPLAGATSDNTETSAEIRNSA